MLQVPRFHTNAALVYAEAVQSSSH